MDWFIADTHLGHARIIDYTKRPFKDVSHMDRVIIDNWNAVVKPSDRVFLLGDFSLGPQGQVKSYAKKLNGRIVLVRGNHDWNAKKFKTLGWESSKTIFFKNYILSHKPVEDLMQAFPGMFNIHGHTHGLKFDRDSPRHVCVSVECIQYTPISIKEVDDIVSLRMTGDTRGFSHDTKGE